MANDRELAETLIEALRRIEADAERALQQGGDLNRAQRDIRDAAGNIAADAAKRVGIKSS